MDKESSWGLKVWNLPNELRAAKGFWEQEKYSSAGKILLTSYQMNVKSYETCLSNFQRLLLEILWTQGEDLHVGFQESLFLCFLLVCLFFFLISLYSNRKMR